MSINLTGTQKQNSMLAEPEVKRNTAATILQSHIRSFNRFHLHQCCIHLKNNPPENRLEPTARLINELGFPIFDIINDLAQNHAIIPTEIWHVTTWKNFSSICAEGALLGAKTMKQRSIEYTPNVLSLADEKRGDGDMICLGAYFIDPDAMVEEGMIKDGVILVKVDLMKIILRGAYNRALKIKDCFSPAFNFSLRMTDWFSVRFISDHGFTCGIIFKIELDDFKVIRGHYFESSQDAGAKYMIYGDHYEINEFCLLLLFHEIQRTKNESLIHAFYGKIKACSRAEISKILKLYGQHHAIFSEYNFNSRLNCTQGLFTEINDLKTGRCYPLKNLELAVYSERIEAIRKRHIEILPFEDKRLDLYNFDEEWKLVGILGKPMSHFNFTSIYFSEVDFADESPNIFMGKDYFNFVEYGQKYKISKVPYRVSDWYPKPPRRSHREISQ